jgi:hypothetical protein
MGTEPKKSNFKFYFTILVVILIIVGAVYYVVDLKLTGKTIDNSCGDGTVQYQNEFLCWQKGDILENANWAKANEYCESLELGGKDDFRLPTVEELLIIVDNSKEIGEIKLDTSVFEESKSKQYWTSTNFNNDDNLHRYVHFLTGYNEPASNSIGNVGARCVRYKNPIN